MASSSVRLEESVVICEVPGFTGTTTSTSRPNVQSLLFKKIHKQSSVYDERVDRYHHVHVYRAYCAALLATAVEFSRLYVAEALMRGRAQL